ncbi:uncharacterized protein LOC144745873 [Ciona intestinalis]
MCSAINIVVNSYNYSLIPYTAKTAAAFELNPSSYIIKKQLLAPWDIYVSGENQLTLRPKRSQSVGPVYKEESGKSNDDVFDLHVLERREAEINRTRKLLEEEENVIKSKLRHVQGLQENTPPSSIGSLKKSDNSTDQPDLSRSLIMMANSLERGPLPARELPKFGGDVLKFHAFMSEFNDNIGNRINDASTKLNYLRSLCFGEAYEAIKSCVVIKPAEKGLEKAFSILHDQFGQRHQIVKAHLNVLASTSLPISKSQELLCGSDHNIAAEEISRLGFTLKESVNGGNNKEPKAHINYCTVTDVTSHDRSDHLRDCGSYNESKTNIMATVDQPALSINNKVSKKAKEYKDGGNVLPLKTNGLRNAQYHRNLAKKGPNDLIMGGTVRDPKVEVKYRQKIREFSYNDHRTQRAMGVYQHKVYGIYRCLRKEENVLADVFPGLRKEDMANAFATRSVTDKRNRNYSRSARWLRPFRRKLSDERETPCQHPRRYLWERC